jgi:hypothetical protein
MEKWQQRNHIEAVESSKQGLTRGEIMNLSIIGGKSGQNQAELRKKYEEARKAKELARAKLIEEE